MARGDLGALWDAWRTRSDEAALLSLLDEVGPELLRTARRYTRDEATAQDLVQSTWQAALSKAHAYDAGQPLLPWLIGFLLVESKRERRRSSRDVDPDRLGPGREEAAPEDAASLDETRHIVRDAVAALPALYRDVVVLAFERGLEPTQIAAQLDREPGTVRVQLHRGLAKLRAALPAGLSLGVAVVCMGGSGEAALRMSLFDAALRRADEVARAAPVAAGAVMWKIAAALLVVATLAGGIWWALAGRDGARRNDAVALVPAADEADANATVLEDARDASAARAPAAVPARTSPPGAADSPGVFVVGSVSGISPSSAAGTEAHAPRITLRPVDQRIPPLASRAEETERFEVDVSAWYAEGGPRPRELFCVVDAHSCMPARVNVWLDDEHLQAALRAALTGTRHEIAVTVALQPAECVVTGRAVVPAGAPRDGLHAVACAALLEQGENGLPAMEPVEAIAADPDGSFRLRAPHAGRYILAVVHTLARPTTLVLDLAAGEQRDVGTMRFEPGAVITGTVRRPDGTPAADARVVARLQDQERARSLHGHPLVWVAQRFEHAARSVMTGAGGTFALDGLAFRTYAVSGDPPSRSEGGPRVVLVLDEGGFGAPASAVRPREEIVTAPATGLELQAESHALLLRVTAGGAPLEKCSVERLFEGGGSAGQLTGADGVVELRASDPPTVDLRMSHLGFHPATITIGPADFAAGSTIEVELERGPAPAWVTFETTGAELHSAFVLLAPVLELEKKSIEPSEMKDLFVPGLVASSLGETGRMQIGMAPGRYRGLIRDAPRDMGPSSFRPTWFDIDVPPGVEYRFRVALEVGGRFRIPPPVYAGAQRQLQVALTDESGHDAPVVFTSSLMRTDARAGQTRTGGLLAGASSTSEPLEPGTYHLSVTAKDAQPFHATVVIEAGKTVEVPVALEPR